MTQAESTAEVTCDDCGSLFSGVRRLRNSALAEALSKLKVHQYKIHSMPRFKTGKTHESGENETTESPWMTFRCEDCDGTFRGRASGGQTAEHVARSVFNRHWWSRHGGSVLTCDACFMVFPQKGGLARHFFSKHPSQNSHKLVDFKRNTGTCDICRLVMTLHGETLAGHFRVCPEFADRESFAAQHNTRDKPAKTKANCDDCSARLSCRKQVMVHWGMAHRGTKAPLAFRCDGCGKTTRRKADVERHVGRRICW